MKSYPEDCNKIPKTLFYKLKPISEDQLPTSKENVVVIR